MRGLVSPLPGLAVAALVVVGLSFSQHACKGRDRGFTPMKGPAGQLVPAPGLITEAAVILHLHITVSQAKRARFLEFCRRAFPIYEGVGGNRMFLYEDSANPGRFDEVGYYRTADDWRRSEDAIKNDPVQAALIREWRGLLNAPPEVTVYRKKLP